MNRRSFFSFLGGLLGCLGLKKAEAKKFKASLVPAIYGNIHHYVIMFDSPLGECACYEDGKLFNNPSPVSLRNLAPVTHWTFTCDRKTGFKLSGEA